MQLAHCLGPEPWTYPQTLEVGTDLPSPDCGAWSGISVRDVNGPRPSDLSSGTWEIEALGFGFGSRVTGTVNVESTPSGGDETFVLEGTLDLPVMRSPDWSDG
jgi:hypothetical protein